MASLKSFTDDELRQKLKEYGISSPVTASTKHILIKKLNHFIANQKKRSTANSSVSKTTTKSSNRLQTLSSDEDEDEFNYKSTSPNTRASRLSRSKRDSVRGETATAETPISARNGATTNYSAGSSCRPSSFLDGRRDRASGRKLKGNDVNAICANSSSLLSVNSFYSDSSATKRTRFSVGTYFPAVCPRSGINPRSKIHDDYDTGSDSDIAESEDAIDLSTKASSAMGMSNNVRENSVQSNNNNNNISFAARASYQNHKPGISLPLEESVIGDGLRSRRGRLNYVENGKRQEEECSEDPDNNYCVAESVVSQSQTIPGNHESVRVANGRHHSELNSSLDPSQGDESTWHYSVPFLLLVLFAVFFGVLAMLYVNMRIPLLPMLRSVPAMIYQYMAKLPVPFFTRTYPEREILPGHPPTSSETLPVIEDPPPLSHTPENKFPLCSNSDIKNDCLTRQEMAAFQPIIGQLESVILPALGHQASLFQCGNSPVSHLSVDELQKITNAETIYGIVALGKLAELNTHWGFKAVREAGDVLLGISLASLPTHFLCHITAAIYSFFYMIVALITAILAGWMTFYCVNYYRQKKELKKQQVFEMVEQILEVLSGLVNPGGKDYVAVNHVRDSLIGPRERNTKKEIWRKAVLFIDNYESRIRREIQSVGGEDCEIWRWTSGLPHSPTNSPGVDGNSGRPPAKMWQGQAFESLETTHNLPNVSPTSCLKIRNMFDCDVEFGDSWPSRIQDSILEKCEGISIVHIAVDRGSKEGCVYLKCGSLVEAGRAFRALHGWWYDGNLVTVKFLRDERYHQRFPIARQATRRLLPSNNKRLSLRVPARQPDTLEHP